MTGIWPLARTGRNHRSRGPPRKGGSPRNGAEHLAREVGLHVGLRLRAQVPFADRVTVVIVDFSTKSACESRDLQSGTAQENFLLALPFRTRGVGLITPVTCVGVANRRPQKKRATANEPSSSLTGCAAATKRGSVPPPSAQGSLRYAFSIAAMSSFTIFSMASVTRFDLAGSRSFIISFRIRGTICHLTP
jgi:hypothetical protein